MTLIGNNSSETKRGIRLRAGTHASFSNTLVTGKPDPLTLETEPTISSFVKGESKFSNVILSGTVKDDGKTTPSYTEALFTAAGNKVNQKLTFTSRFVGTVDGAGAVPADDDWTAGWTL